MENFPCANAISNCKYSFAIKKIPIAFSDDWRSYIERVTALRCLILCITLAGLNFAYISYILFIPLWVWYTISDKA